MRSSSGLTFEQVFTDIAAGDRFRIIGSSTWELTDSDGRQASLGVYGETKQTGTAAFDALYINPAIESLGDGSTGDGNNLLNLATNGASQFVVQLDGDTGIGTSAPRVKLDVPFGAIASGTTIAYATAGPTDNLDVSAKNSLICYTTDASVTIGGLAGGVAGQRLEISKKTTEFSLILEHNEVGGSQDIILPSGADESIGPGSLGGWTLICDGTSWYASSSAGVFPAMACMSINDYSTNAFSVGSATIITNLAVNVASAGFTTSVSNVINHVAGWYEVSAGATLDMSTAPGTLDVYLFTNNVIATDASGNKVGFDVTVSAAGSHSAPFMSKMIYLPAGCTNDFRVEPGANETVIFEHGVVRFVKK